MIEFLNVAKQDKKIHKFILSDISDEDFVLCEIGGTVGDIESLPFLEAIRQLGNELGQDRTIENKTNATLCKGTFERWYTSRPIAM